MGRIAWSGAAAIALFWALASCGGGGTEATSGSQSAPHHPAPAAEYVPVGTAVLLPHPGKRLPGQSPCDSAAVKAGSHGGMLNVDAQCYSSVKGGRGSIVISQYVIGRPLHVTPILLWSEHPVLFERDHRVGVRGNCHKLESGVSCEVPIAGPSKLRVRLLVNFNAQCNGISVVSVNSAPCSDGARCAGPVTRYQIFHGRPKGC